MTNKLRNGADFSDIELAKSISGFGEGKII